ncbi:hypothetical protein B0J11DRAFT_289156 [Dendryphion nanum]|uniref:Uncharacterized protein n=1 Tax=Dendryphion nanum TaxID=256645 RepID=A0A9P9INK9_9PLEO|nr:hypothetical protein B0J11DRAFT_289156 [Dendryphion nanum]
MASWYLWRSKRKAHSKGIEQRSSARAFCTQSSKVPSPQPWSSGRFPICECCRALHNASPPPGAMMCHRCSLSRDRGRDGLRLIAGIALALVSSHLASAPIRCNQSSSPWPAFPAIAFASSSPPAADHAALFLANLMHEPKKFGTENYSQVSLLHCQWSSSS